MDWGEIDSHKHIKQTHTGSLLIDAHNTTHLSGFLIFPKSDRTPLCFHRPTQPTETTLGVLFKHFWGNMLSATTNPRPLPPPPTRKKKIRPPSMLQLFFPASVHLQNLTLRPYKRSTCGCTEGGRFMNGVHELYV